jgi:HAD superfamily hydrolase (TIGR01509 family)
MIKALLFDFSRVLLFPRDESYTGSLNEKHRTLSEESSYNILDHFVLNEELLQFLDKIKGRVGLYIFTTDTIQDDPVLKARIEPVFKEIFSANKLGLSKQDPDSYTQLAEKMGLKTYEILFIDDSIRNTEEASQSGMRTLHYVNNQELLLKLKDI